MNCLVLGGFSGLRGFRAFRGFGGFRVSLGDFFFSSELVVAGLVKLSFGLAEDCLQVSFRDLRILGV